MPDKNFHMSSARLLGRRQGETLRVSESDNGSCGSYVSRSGRFQTKPVNLYGLIALIFFSVSGGPFGSEPSVASGGPFWALVGFTVFPLIWCLPEALITAELSSLFPGNSGFTCWVGGSFGSPFLGYMEGFCSFVSTVTNCTVYPRLFIANLQQAFPVLEDSYAELACMLLFVVLNGYVNFRGMHIVGNLGIVLLVLVMAPFVILVVCGIPHANTANFTQGWDTFPDAARLLSLFNVLFWNLNNWDAISTLAGEVRNPRAMIPKALLASLTLIGFTYIFPLAVGIGLMHPGEDIRNWEPGYYQTVAKRIIPNNWLSSWILVAAVLGSIGQFQSLVSSCAYQIEGMACLGWLPRSFAIRSRYRTPIVGLSIAVMSVMLLVQLSFINILEYLNIVYAMAMLLEFIAFIYMRFSYSTVRAPFRVPLNFVGICVMMLFPTACISAIVFLPIFAGRWDIIAVGAGALFGGVATYNILEYLRRAKKMEFIMEPPMDFHQAVMLHLTDPQTNSD